ncbi:hypothetical protein DdX_14029 [Ditylenchus destructor]|uniref:Uncharacterized protein n=1 Tax=Ditylenchus destructor TaxID=166010 RepID=A0AAD4MSY3_9BILA|nr:hypothetical protein DdX_14029 [Ditylenchus destructor]
MGTMPESGTTVYSTPKPTSDSDSALPKSAQLPKIGTKLGILRFNSNRQIFKLKSPGNSGEYLYTATFDYAESFYCAEQKIDTIKNGPDNHLVVAAETYNRGQWIENGTDEVALASGL